MKSITLDEIKSQPDVWQKVIDQDENFITDGQKDIVHDRQSGAVFIGCGTSYYLAQSAASVFSAKSPMMGSAVTASDIMLFPELTFSGNPERYRPYLISRSGTTTEILLAAEKIKNSLNIKTTGISCRPDSELMDLVDYRLLVPQADEQSVVMTRSFTSMLLKFQLLAASLSGDNHYAGELRQLPGISESLFSNYGDLVSDIVDENDFDKYVYLGQGPFYGLANESMLKIKEMSLSISEAYHSLEFRHGPKSMVDEGMLVTLLFSNTAYDREVKLLKEIKSLGGITLSICDNATKEIDEYSDYVIELKSGLSDFARLILYMPITQLLGFHVAVARDLNPDQPTNLTQVVTL